MAVKLTKRLVEAIEPSATDVFAWDTLAGFGVRVSPAGRRTFIAQYRLGGRGSKSRRVVLGTFGELTVEQAREQARRILAAAADGRDHVSEKEAEAARAEAERRAAVTVRTLASRYLAEHVGLKRKPRTLDAYRQIINSHVLPALGDREARSITRADMAALHAGLADRPVMANRVLAVVSAMFTWAARVGVVSEDFANPAGRIEKFKERAHDQFLTSAELARLGAAIRLAETDGVPWEPSPEKKAKHAPRPEHRRVKIAPDVAAALRLLIFSGMRLREVLGLEWRDVDWDRGLLRLRDSKTGPKAVILNGPARDVLAGLPRVSRYVIPGQITTAPDGTRVEKPRADLKRPWSLVLKAAGLDGLRIHDLRHSFASAGAADGLGLTTVGALLGHKRAETTLRYSHFDHDPLRRASDSIAGKISAALDGQPPAGEVVPIRKRR